MRAGTAKMHAANSLDTRPNQHQQASTPRASPNLDCHDLQPGGSATETFRKRRSAYVPYGNTKLSPRSRAAYASA